MAVTTPDPEPAEPPGNGGVSVPNARFSVLYQIHKLRNPGGGFQPSGAEKALCGILTGAHLWQASLESFRRDTGF